MSTPEKAPDNIRADFTPAIPPQEGFRGQAEQPEPEHILFGSGDLVAANKGEEAKWKVSGAFKVGDEIYIKLISPDGNTVTSMPQEKLLENSLEGHPSEIEKRLEAAEEAGEAAVEETVELKEGIETDTKKISEVSAEVGEIAVHEYDDEETPTATTTRPSSATTSSASSGSGAGSGGHRGGGRTAGTSATTTAPTGGGPGRPRPPLTPDQIQSLKNEARINHLRWDAVERALDTGVENPISYLANSRGTELEKKLTHYGYDLTPPPDIITTIHPDPLKSLDAQGENTRAEILAIQKRIEDKKDSKKLRWELDKYRPGHLPLRLHKIFSTYPGRIVLAWRMRKELMKTEKEKSRRDPKFNKSTNGFMNLGINHFFEFGKHLKGLDEDVRVERSKLRRSMRKEIEGPIEEKRRNLAEDIYHLRKKLVAAGNLKVNPDDFYDHEPVSEDWKKYRSTLDKGRIEENRAEFIRLRKLGVRSPEEEEIFRKTLASHPDWGKV